MTAGCIVTMTQTPVLTTLQSKPTSDFQSEYFCVASFYLFVMMHTQFRKLLMLLMLKPRMICRWHHIFQPPFC